MPSPFRRTPDGEASTKPCRRFCGLPLSGPPAFGGGQLFVSFINARPRNSRRMRFAEYATNCVTRDQQFLIGGNYVRGQTRAFPADDSFAAVSVLVFLAIER